MSFINLFNTTLCIANFVCVLSMDNWSGVDVKIHFHSGFLTGNLWMLPTLK